MSRNGFYIVPAEGAGPVHYIIDARDVPGDTPELSADLQAIAFDSPPGVPVSGLHWDGSAVVDGPYISPEEEAKQVAMQEAEEAQDLLNSRLVHFDYDLTTSLITRMTPDPDLFIALAAATTVEEIQPVLEAVLNRISLTEEELAMMNGYREKYEDWFAKQAAAEGE